MPDTYKNQGTSVVMVMTGSQKITLWGPGGTPLGILRVKDRRGYCHLKEEALDRTVWRNRFGRDFGPVVSQTEY
jgi:hypothetical protein